MASCLKKIKVKLDLLTDIDMILMAGEGIRGGICHTPFIDMQKLTTNTWKLMIKKRIVIFSILGCK